jgi:hypothetical protein
MRTSAPSRFVTAKPWGPTLQHASYGADETYRLAADWLRDCPTVADWGGGAGYFGRFLPELVQYTVVDGTEQGDGQVLADLTTYHEPSDGILLRHVLDNTPDWQPILHNALAAFRQRLVVITFTPSAPTTHIARVKSGWPIWSFNPDDLMLAMGALLVRFEFVPTSHPERVYFLERSA